MEIKNRKRSGDKGHTVIKSDKKAKFNFDISILDLMCSYVVSSNAHIKRGNLINMRNLIEAIDLDIYAKDPEKMNRIRFIQRGIQARLEKDLKNPTLIMTHINGGMYTEIDLNSFNEISNSELEYIDTTVAGALKATFLDSDMEKFHELYLRYKAEDYRYKDEFIKEVQEFVTYMYNKFRRAEAESIYTSSFTLEAEKFENSISDTYDKLTAPGRYLACTMQGMNAITGGGFEATRVYLYLGLAGIGKSMLMLNLALQMKKANNGYITKDPTKKPTIIYLTQENGIDETVDRICKIISGKNMAHFSKEEVIRILKEDGELFISDDNNININIIYRPDRSIDTGDLYTIIEDLEDDGYETIALFQDHIKRIRSIDKSVHKDIRLELGAVMNELKILAQIKEIPIITVSHLNRDAAKTIDNAVTGNKFDLTRLLGRSNIGESMLMQDNADYVYIAGREVDSMNNEYLMIKCIKSRNSSNIDFVCLPFAPNNGTKLIEDLYSPVPVFKTTLVPDSQQSPIGGGEQKIIQLNGSVSSEPTYTSLNNITQIDNIFNSLGTLYTGANDDMYSFDLNPTITQSVIEPKPFISWTA